MKIYKRYCNNCDKYYEGYGRSFCSYLCSNKCRKYHHRKSNVRLVLNNLDIIQKYQKGLSLRCLARYFNISVSTIYNRLIDNNIKLRPSGGIKGKKATEETKKKMSESHIGKHKYWLGKKNPNHSKRMSGEKNPSWQDGASFKPYTLDFNEQLKEKIRKRDNNTCQECDYTKEQLGYSPCVHHIDYNKENCNEDNLITLCRSCNTKANFGRKDWTNYFKKKLYAKTT